eukprot:301005-Chlamydomonas_euryale.AAC.2
MLAHLPGSFGKAASGSTSAARVQGNTSPADGAELDGRAQHVSQPENTPPHIGSCSRKRTCANMLACEPPGMCR